MLLTLSLTLIQQLQTLGLFSKNMLNKLASVQQGGFLTGTHLAKAVRLTLTKQQYRAISIVSQQTDPSFLHQGYPFLSMQNPLASL